MRSTYYRGLLAVAAVVTLAACSGSSGSSGGAGYGGGGGASTQNPAAASTDDNGMAYGAGSSGAAGATALATASTSLGTIVVDGRGMTAYVFDKDTRGASSSACTGACATAWPAIESSSPTPSVQGVTGTVGTITGIDGKPQVTLDGRPLYTYALDTKAGDTTGQGYGGVWWVVSPDGKEIGK
jgi:predicted lipoprotein with Yx(FWY)xxD motif